MLRYRLGVATAAKDGNYAGCSYNGGASRVESAKQISREKRLINFYEAVGPTLLPPVKRDIHFITFELQVRGGNLLLSEIGLYGQPRAGMLAHNSHKISAPSQS